jgi:glycosyl transferase family 25
LAFHQQAADELGGNLLGGAGEEALGEGWETLGGRGGYGSGLKREALLIYLAKPTYTHLQRARSMPISDKHRIIFIHIPKNAGTALEKSLDARLTSHKDWRFYKKNFPAEWGNYTKLAVIRDPITRFVSCYNYARMEKSFWHSSIPGDKSKYGKHPDYEICRAHTIDELTNLLFQGKVILKHPGWMAQYIWIEDSGKIAVDHLIDFTRLDDSIKELAPNANLQRINESSWNPSSQLEESSVLKLKEVYNIDSNLAALVKESRKGLIQDASSLQIQACIKKTRAKPTFLNTIEKLQTPMHSSNNQRTSSGVREPEWETVAITLDAQGSRFNDFTRNNKHLNITPFQAVRGDELAKEEIVKQRLATDDLASTTLLTSGAIGCAASHKAIWEKSVKETKSYFAMEDDCYTHPKINDFIATNIDRLTNADICFFGINTDSILVSTSPQGLTSVSLFEPKHPSPEWIAKSLSKTSANRVELHRLIKAFGSCAYFISPKGAQKLIERIFPLSLKTTNIPLISQRMPAISIDRSGCAIYAEIEALICKPFLAYTPNIDSTTKQ